MVYNIFIKIRNAVVTWMSSQNNIDKRICKISNQRCFATHNKMYSRRKVVANLKDIDSSVAMYYNIIAEAVFCMMKTLFCQLIAD